MFIRVKKKAEDRISVQIVANIRDGDKVKQKIIRHVGVAHNDKELEQLKDLATFIKISIEEEKQPNLIPAGQLAATAIKHRKMKENDQTELNVNLKALREEARTTIGIHEVFGSLYEQLRFDTLFTSRDQAAGDYLKNIVMARIANPDSKRASVKLLKDDFGIRLNLDMVYRMMDKLDQNIINKIKDLSFFAGKNLLADKFNVLFYDATTLYFESVEEDELRSKGYSKDMKFNQVQVLLAIMVGSNGIPMGYELFPGKKFEGHTLQEAVAGINSQYNLDKIYIVADRGLLSAENLAYLEASGHQYIVGGRLKNLPKKMQEQILALESYQAKGKLLYQDIEMANRRIISHYCPKRAKKDSYERQKSVEKLVKKIGANADSSKLISNYGYRKYIKISGESAVSIDQNKLQHDARWDGICGVITNDSELTAEEVLAHYKGLWQIEETFRISKHDLQIRPIYHWSPGRIEAHIAICYIALVLVRHLEYRVAVQYTKLSPAVIIDNLLRIQLTFLRHKTSNEQYCIPSKVTDEANKIYQIITGFAVPKTPFKIN